MSLRAVVTFGLALMSSSIALADSCPDQVEGALEGPPPSFRSWNLGDACYVAWPGGGGKIRETYERQCENIEGYISFSGDYGSNRNICIFKQGTNNKDFGSKNATEIPPIGADKKSELERLPENTRNTLSFFKSQSDTIRDFARNLFEYDFVAGARRKELAETFNKTARRWLESYEILEKLRGTPQADQDRILQSIPENINKVNCMAYLQEAGENLGESGRLDIAERVLGSYNNICGENNYMGLNSVQQSLAWRAKDLRKRMSGVLKEIQFEFWVDGTMPESQCKERGGYPESGISSPTDKDPVRRCFMTKYKDFRPVKIGRNYDGICPDGTPVSTTGTCPAK